MHFSKRFNIISYDLDSYDRIKTSTLWRYMQETANAQMLSEGPSYEELFNKGLSFILSRMNLQIYSGFKAYEDITVETWAAGEHGAAFDRNYRALNLNGEILAEGHGIWALLDINKGTLLRCNEVDLNYSSDSLLDMPHNIKFRLPKDIEFKQVDRRRIYYNETDKNKHLNNTYYPDIILNYVDEHDNYLLSNIRISFLHEAPLNSEVTFFTAKEYSQDGITYYIKSFVGDKPNIESIVEMSSRYV